MKVNLFRRKCEYCKSKIDKGSEIKRNVKVLGFIGTYLKYFCCSEHADNYEKETEQCMKNSKHGENCCG